MDCAISVVENKYIFANQVKDYSWTYIKQLKCPYCLEAVIYRDGGYNTPHFAHYKEGLASSITCPFRTSSAYSSMAEYEKETKGQTLLKQFQFFSKHFDSFISYSDETTVIVKQSAIDKIRLILNREYGENPYVKELLRANMLDFFTNTLKHFIQKKEIDGEVIIRLNKDILKLRVIEKYLICIEGFRTYYYSCTRSWDFKTAGKAFSHLFCLEPDINKYLESPIPQKNNIIKDDEKKSVNTSEIQTSVDIEKIKLYVDDFIRKKRIKKEPTKEVKKEVKNEIIINIDNPILKNTPHKKEDFCPYCKNIFPIQMIKLHLINERNKTIKELNNNDIFKDYYIPDYLHKWLLEWEQKYSSQELNVFLTKKIDELKSTHSFSLCPFCNKKISKESKDSHYEFEIKKISSLYWVYKRPYIDNLFGNKRNTLYFKFQMEFNEKCIKFLNDWKDKKSEEPYNKFLKKSFTDEKIKKLYNEFKNKETIDKKTPAKQSSIKKTEFVNCPYCKKIFRKTLLNAHLKKCKKNRKRKHSRK